MKVAFRTDASIQIGTGHVMRCLTLADALTAKGAQCEFICREHSGNLIDHIRSKGYFVQVLPSRKSGDVDLAHSAWLGATQEEDAYSCAPILAKLQPNWLVVDHYALDARWEGLLTQYCGQLMVIDDLADRLHACQILLDQTFGRSREDYRQLVPSKCILLCGSNYALLRPQFAGLRSYSLQRRARPHLKRLLVTLGGVDKDNITAQVMGALRNSSLPADCEITVVMGATAPWLADVQCESQNMPWPTTVQVGVNNMAQLMADSDLAIGAAGATSWELCCLGVPAIIMVLAENQNNIAQRLADMGAAILVDEATLQEHLLLLDQSSCLEILLQVSRSASAITDGLGAARVVNFLLNEVRDEN